MQTDIICGLEDVGYNGILLDDKKLEAAVEGGAKSVEYTRLVEWLCKELKTLCHLEEQVNVISSKEESSNFLMEISSFLKELGCSYTSLTEGHVSERLNTEKDKLLLLDYLLSELMAARMIRVDKPHLNKGIELKLQESSTAADLKALLLALRFPKPPDNITPAILFSKIEQKLKEVLNGATSELIGKPLFAAKLGDKPWKKLEETQSELSEEYRVRRDMLIKRLDVTVQSFLWSDKGKNNVDEITRNFNAHREKMEVEPNVLLADLLAAREDIAIVEKASSASVRKNTQTALNKVIIGRVPDRGGRPSEQEAPPPEMPSWQKERAQVSGGGGRGRGGGRVQGNWNQQNRQESRGSYQDNRGGYQDNRGGYHGNRGDYHDNRNYEDNKNYQDSRGGYRGNRRGGRGGGSRREYR